MTKRKILVVDDESDFVNLLKARLERNGYVVITAGDGQECLRLINDENPDAVLLDVIIPKLGGLETLARIREHNRQLPVFIMTAHADEKNFKEANNRGASGFLVKTGNLQKEVENITTVLGVSRTLHPNE